jgi:2,3-bisphosphoglycerate-independent phosphoglycerate mutase
MKYILFALHGYLELFKKRGQKTLFDYAKKENFESFMEKGEWGYILLDKTIEKSYFYFFYPEGSFPGEGFIRSLKYSIPSGKDNIFFLSQFLTVYENKIIETDINLNIKEKQKLIEEIKKENQSFEFFTFENDIILRISKDLPFLNNKFPNKIKGKNIEEVKFKKENFEIIDKLMENSSKILNSNPINEVRMDLNEPVANFLYLYGMGKFKEKIPLSQKIKKNTFYFSDFKTIDGLRIFFDIEKINEFSDIKDDSFYWFDFILNPGDTPSIWVKNFEAFTREILKKILNLEDARFLFIFDPFMNENYEYDKTLCLFLAVNFKKKTKRKYKNPSILFKSFIE